jgi:cytochrome b6-f complex iron-sulfur subunit
MDRRLFLESIGIGAAFALTATCLQSCKHDPVIAPTNTGSTGTTGTTGGTTTTGFTIDLTASINAALKTNGGYIIQNGIVIARDNSGNYVAATQTCSHAGQTQVVFRANEFYCDAHGARFSATGAGLNSIGSAGLKTYKTALEGTSTLRIYNETWEYPLFLKDKRRFLPRNE